MRKKIVNLHYMLSKAVVKSRPTALWCYKDKLELSSHKKKRSKQIKKLMQRGLLDPEKVDPFSLFVETGGLTYCMYKDSERILGNTFGMCILQDFEALTPNLLARTIETVEGGGLIILLLRSLSSLTSLCTMVMDVHERFRTESHSGATGRFNERFLLSLSSCKSCVVMDDELNILPISSHMKSIKPVSVEEDSEGLSEAERELKNLKEQLNDDFPVGPLMRKCCTLDQGKAVITFLDAILDKTLRGTVALLAARGRGKSAALGLAIAGAIAAGYSNIYVTAPSPENLKTLFEFICKGFDSLEFKEHLDYDVVRSSNPEFKKATVRINIYKQHRQTIQYIQPHEHEKLSQVELLVVDEAAAIPLPVVKSLLGPYLVFLSSTVNGYDAILLIFLEVNLDNRSLLIPVLLTQSYEGTGRSLSLKLLQQLEEQSATSTKSVEGSISGRLFKKIELSESIRYASGDPIESWLHALLCLDVANSIPNISRLPPPSECDLYYVNRDTLFSYHRDSELFLQRMMALYVASHYKNSPNDLQLMSDAPAHHLFVLLGPVDESQNHLPDILCVIQWHALEPPYMNLGNVMEPEILVWNEEDMVPEELTYLTGGVVGLQVCLEGQISRKSAMKSLTEGHQPFGDQIAWKFCEQFRDTVFPSLSGARIVRIATHPSAMRLGYGSTAVELLTRYFEGHLTTISEVDVDNAPESPHVRVTEAAEKVSLLEENIKPRTDLPPLLVHLRERRPERLHYLGVSFGLTMDLFRFWRKHKFAPFYICQIPSTVTGEHTCMVLKPLNNEDVESSGLDQWGFFSPFYQDFRERFRGLLDSSFRAMEYKLAMSVLDPKISFTDLEPALPTISDRFLKSLDGILTPFDMKRLEAYINNLADYRMIWDLVPKLANPYFREKFPVTLSYAQASVLLCTGLQRQDISYVEGEMKLERQQILSLFIKVMKKLYRYLYDIASKEIDSIPSRLREIVLEPHAISVDEDLNEAAEQVKEGMKAKMMESSLNPELLQQYAIADREADFEKALQNGGGKVPSGGLISVKTNRNKAEKLGKQKESHKRGKKSNKEDGSSKSNKKRKF
ncbi:hypothetical protein RHMOL_Rhmol08G0006900 [Rhododendron molle]|uniref:Uncharacterized protein n=1 Tax=Rhododendron molle TaxID=49168 RepID=A0ACC0MJF8_RHOML|nr:hypothetical protein RHMOL_Rhmol08G0006900 [Rhododendron molle]